MICNAMVKSKKSINQSINQSISLLTYWNFWLTTSGALTEWWTNFKVVKGSEITEIDSMFNNKIFSSVLSTYLALDSFHL